MSDETASETTEQATEVPASIIGTDGALVDDWQKQAPEGYEDLRGDESLSTVKNFWNLSKSYVHIRKQVPVDKMPRPTDKWGDDDWNEYYDAGGRPSTAADFNIKRHEEIPEEAFTDEMITGFQDLFHKIGLNQKQVNAIVEYNDGLTLAKMKTMAQENEDAGNVVQDTLRKDWGLAYDQNVHRGNIAIDRDKDVEGDPAYKARLLEKVNKDPDLIRFASNMGYKFVEHKIVEDPGIPSPIDLQKQIADIMTDPRYTHEDLSVRQPLIDKVQRLYQQLNKNK